ncbi:MAG: hypothetical protein K6G33_08050 [Ruminococcus sp.]|uniref:hypothetical protein n=1 Tax=Ruminococcus sp. TaxID=41978 RepID=UPI0025D71702|nr:hypothetical protein [Ruminococcus sp.]MCR5600676.1 hypothetical protein [Ruminococcus sp.]
MKHVLKKISAIAMAFTLLGAGTAIAKNVAPQSIPTLTASAADGWYYQTTCNKVVVTHWDGSTSSYTYNNLAVYCSRDWRTLKMSTPSVPVPIYCYSVQAVRFYY